MNALTLTEGRNGVEVADLRLLERVDAGRMRTSAALNQDARSEMGQYMTPLPVARLMASMLLFEGEDISLLDAGAGIGTLTAAAIEELCLRQNKPHRIHVTAYEIDPLLTTRLQETLHLCARHCDLVGIQFEAQILEHDFIHHTAERLGMGLFSNAPDRPFTCAIQNPPYRKINTCSNTRERLRQLGIETTNLYTGFLAATLQLLKPGGELVAITPRSFCNGPYFRPFREFMLRKSSLRRIHLFDSRQKAFQDDAVLQETAILHTVVNEPPPDNVLVTSSPDADGDLLTRWLPYKEVVRPGDKQSFIHIVQDGISVRVGACMDRFTTSLDQLGVTVSTGRVVDFRAKPYLRSAVEENTVPLIYPANFHQGYVAWPKQTRKPLAIEVVPHTSDQLVPNENYVLVKRFSSKEERRRIVAAIYDPSRIPCDRVGFENHLNYFHRNGRGLEPELARGLFLFLNSTLVDSFFRQFNGHTQVNATDLRNMRYPTADQLRRLSASVEDEFPNQTELDKIITEELMAGETQGADPIAAKKKIDEATQVLTEIGLPRAQLNERSALTLLSLLNLTPDKEWAAAEPALIGITPMMDFMKEHYGKEYAPNTRETVRRQTIHQFVQAGFTLENPDDPEQPTNSPTTVYRVETTALELLRTFGTSGWKKKLKRYLAEVPALKVKYAQAREMKRIPIALPNDTVITLSPGGQNELVERIMADFAEIFTPGGKPLYIGDTDDKYAHHDEAALRSLGVQIESHGKMPDVIIHHTQKDWLVLIEAVTSHGPINAKRQRELKELFNGCKIGLVLVTAFLTRKAMMRYLSEISWETDVWIAETPEHLIHFNGGRFLGPYE